MNAFLIGVQLVGIALVAASIVMWTRIHRDEILDEQMNAENLEPEPRRIAVISDSPIQVEDLKAINILLHSLLGCEQAHQLMNELLEEIATLESTEGLDDALERILGGGAA